MLSTIDSIAFIREVETAILEYCKEVHELSYVEHGQNNIIALVNQAYAFRFPRDEPSARRLVFETALLQKLKGRINVVQIPEVQKVHTGHLYTVATYIPGEQLTAQQIQALKEDEQQALGRKLAVFIDQLNKSISGLEVRRLRAEANVPDLHEAMLGRYSLLFGKNPLPNDSLRPIVNQYYPRWLEYGGSEQAGQAIHDKLYPGNLLFKVADLTGIVDFADTTIGSIEAGMRGLYEMGDTVLKAAIDHYRELTNVQVAYDSVRIWAIIQELATFTELLAAQQTEGAVFKEAQERLQHWVPGFPL